MKTISAELAAAGVCYEPLPDDIYLLLMDGLGKWSTQLNKAQQNLSTAVQRGIYTTALKVGADGASIILDVVGAGAAIRGTRKVGAAAKASGRIAKGLGRWAKVAGATGKLVLKIEAYKTLSDLVSVAAGGASLLVDDLYFSQVGLTSEQQADVVGDYASFIADAIPLGLDALPALGEFLKGSTPLRGDAKIEFVKFIVVAYTKIGSDASNEGLTWDTSKDLGLEALSTGLSFVPFAGGMYDAWRDYNDFASKLNQVFEGFDKTLDQYTAHTETLLTSSLAQKLARRFQDQEDRTGSLTAKTLLDFGKIKRGLSEQLTLTVRNVGTDSLSIGTDEIDDAAFKVDATTYTGSVVPGATCSYSITFLISYLPQERR